MKNDLISIIIPVYKVEKYLEKCIESVLKQTYDNYEIIVFNALSKDVIYQILDKLVKDLNKKITNQRITISLTDKAKEWIVDNGYDHNYGARPLKRFLTKNLETLLAKKLIDGSIISGDKLTIDVKDNNLVINK